MAVCRAHGWSFTQFGQLSDFDRELALAYELHRRKTMRDMQDRLIAREHYTPEAATLITLARF